MTLIRCVDVETSGLDPAVHRICEIATVDVIVSPKLLMPSIMEVERGEMWSSLVNPERAIPPEASAVHDIVDEMVKDAPKIGELSGKINFVHGKDGPPDYWCAHHNRFDMQFINPPGAVWLDTYRIALWLWPSAPEHKLATLRYWLNLKLGLDLTVHKDSVIRSHRALWDAYICAAVLRRAFTSDATIEQMLDVSSQPALLPRFTFGEHAMKPIEEVPSGYLDWILSPKGIKNNVDVAHTAFAELQRRRNLERLQSS